MMPSLIQFAAAQTGEKTDFFGSLGIDWTLLVLQLVAFLVLVWLLGKFVYPVFLKIIDERQAKLEAGTKAAAAAEKKAAAAEADVEKLMKKARQDAQDIVATAKDEAAQTREAAEKTAKTRAERIVADAQERLEKDVIAAKKALRRETIDLVADATEKVVGKTVSPTVDKKLIQQAVEEAK